MTTKIDGVEFEVQAGIVEPMTRPVKSFSSALTPGIGAQVFGERGESFTITLKAFRDSSQLESIKRFVRSKQGKIVQLAVDGLIYLLPQNGGLRFFVERVEITEASIIPLAAGHRSTGPYSHSPAAKVVSRFTMRAIR